MIPVEQFSFYKDFALKAFNYLNPRINRFITPRIIIDYADTVNFTFANIRRPNTLFVHIANIVVECGNGYNKNKVFSMILTVLTHELFHTEQAMSQERYRNDRVYKSDVENAVNAMAYQFLIDHKKEIDQYFEMNLDFFYFRDFLCIDKIYQNYLRLYYKCNTAEEIYKYTIMNVIYRKDQSYLEFEELILNKYKNVFISFDNESVSSNNGTNFLIKSNGIFCEFTLSNFISEVGVAAGIYDRYTMEVYTIVPNRDKEDTVNIVFKLSNRLIYPIQFGKD